MKMQFLPALCLSILSSGFGLAQNQQVFTTVGTNEFTAPQGVLSVAVETIGGGGGGGRVDGSSARESGGGGGGAYAKGIISVIPGEVYPLGVGAAGVQNSGVAVHGGTSYFGSDSEIDSTTTVRAEGGRTLILSDGSQGTGAIGGRALNSVGNRAVFSGGNGGNTSSNTYGGGGGAAASANGDGAAGGQGTPGQATGPYAGNGGNGGVSGGDDDGVEGTNYGGGGGGARKSFSGISQNRYGASGAHGIVVISWSTISDFSPAVMCAGASDLVTVNGVNFVAVDSVSINGVNVPFSEISSTQLTISVPTGVSTGNIIVYSSMGASISSEVLTVNDFSLELNLLGTVLEADYNGTTDAVYEWKNCVTSTVISNETSSTYSPSQNGIYSVSVTDQGCVQTSECITVASLSALEVKKDEASIFPNPTSDYLTIDTKENIATELVLVDQTGKVVRQFEPINTRTVLNVSDLQKGLYILQVIYSSEETKMVSISIQ